MSRKINSRTPEQRAAKLQEIQKWIEQGKNKHEACALAGVAKSTYMSWLNRGEKKQRRHQVIEVPPVASKDLSRVRVLLEMALKELDSE